MDQLMKLNARDREMLLAMRVDRILGMILKLNQRSHYHNTLDAIRLTSRLMELKDQRSRHDARSSDDITVPSGKGAPYRA